MKESVLLTLLGLLLMGCSPFMPNTGNSTPVDSVDIPAAATTSSPTAAVIPTIDKETVTPRPTSTRESTTTPDAILLTEDAMVSSCAMTERVWYTKHLSGTYFINGQWGAVVCSDNGIYTKVFNTSQNITWTVPSVNDPRTSDPAWYWIPYLWSEDGKYLYMEAECLCFIDSPWLIYSSGFGISRLDLSTGQLDTWLKPNDNPWYTFAFTEDGTWFAFSPKDFPGTIKIRDLVSSEEQTLSFKEKYSILEYRWTPDHSKLVILTEETDVDPAESGFSVFVYRVRDEVLIKILEKDRLNSSFPTEEFIEPRIQISGLSNEVLYLSDIFQENNSELNIRTGILVLSSALTATPAP